MSVRTGPGVIVGGRYRLLRRIAVGGMGEVWEGLDQTLDRPVAVKVLRAEFAGDATFLARFRTEARNSAALSHPHIAALFDYGEEGGSAYLVQELVDGEPLSELLEREPVLPPARLVPLLSQAARGLHYAHHLGVVHRDVKPGNLLVASTGRLKITDFGVSLAQDQMPMTATGMVMGTAQYLSPEQAVGRPATPLSDLYALGIVAYEALAGHRPFTGGSAVDIAVAQVNDPVPPLPARVDPALAALVERLLAKDPTERPASGLELARLLDALVPHTPPQGVPAAAAAGRTVGGSVAGPPAVAGPMGGPSAPSAGPLPPSYAPAAGVSAARRPRGPSTPTPGHPAPGGPVAADAAPPGPARTPRPTRTSPGVRRRRALLVVGVLVVLAILVGLTRAARAAEPGRPADTGASAGTAVSAPGAPGYPRRDDPRGDHPADPAAPALVRADGTTVKDT